ncbi:MAG: hypothetical protein WDA20_13160 [Desulfuromonadales bacterium]
MAWYEAKAALGTKLAAVAVTSPEAQQIHTVFTEPPPSIEEGLLPCIYVGDAPFDDEWDSALALESYEVECFLLLRNEDVQQAVLLAEAYRQAVKDQLRASVKLGRSEVTLTGATFERLSEIRYANKVFDGFRFTVRLVINDESPGFAAG